MSFSPVENGFSNPPHIYPLGYPLKDRVSINTIPKQVANLVHTAHHSYVNGLHNGIVHHGIYLRDEWEPKLVGAITYSYLLASEPIHGYESDEYIQVARVTIANDTPNLASCGMAKSQDQFVEDYAESNDIGLLVSYVRADYKGSMFKALRGKGWRFDGHIVTGHQAGNRVFREIREWDKKRFVCEL